MTGRRPLRNRRPLGGPPAATGPVALPGRCPPCPCREGPNSRPAESRGNHGASRRSRPGNSRMAPVRPVTTIDFSSSRRSLSGSLRRSRPLS
ncbi:hypothetical protein AOX55_00005285 (plasmid) [Sinorhizobium fredii CCBAU 25509]|nr:hypothetical protein AOX55_00005285 [Sinorhizobium fredii CCBAU 25509]